MWTLYFRGTGFWKTLETPILPFSPGIILGNRLVYAPQEKLQIALLTKFVGKQYMGNIDSDVSVLDSYSQTDLNVQFEIPTASFIKSIVLSGLVNNIFDEKYVSNGYFFTFDDVSPAGAVTTFEGAGFYPQAGINFLVGATVNFLK